MQTFLPYPDFVSSAKCLDSKRLGKQRSEALILVKTILEDYNNSAWQHHPITKMWKPYLGSLIFYGIHICQEWRFRDYKDSTLEVFQAYQDHLLWEGFQQYKEENIRFMCRPHWLGNTQLHASHRSNLLRKDPSWYGQFGWTEPNNLPYHYPLG